MVSALSAVFFIGTINPDGTTKPLLEQLNPDFSGCKQSSAVPV